MRSLLFAVLLSATAAPVFAQELRGRTNLPDGALCLEIDETRDMLAADDRAGAVLLLAREFEQRGRRVVSGTCATPYVLTHVRLGQHIFVALSGTGSSREGAVRVLDDLPVLYRRMVDSIVSGIPMTGFSVADLPDPTPSARSANQSHGGSHGYARLGYGTVFGERAYGAPGFGFGYRFEHESLGLDLSFLNWHTGGTSGEASDSATAFSLVKLQALRFLKPGVSASPYIGGGLSWGITDFESFYSEPGTFGDSWHGSGLQGELTFGYELPRTSAFRVFVETNVVLPFYKVASQTYSYRSADMAITTARRYAPTLVISVGIGWRGNRG